MERCTTAFFIAPIARLVAVSRRVLHPLHACQYLTAVSHLLQACGWLTAAYHTSCTPVGHSPPRSVLVACLSAADHHVSPPLHVCWQFPVVYRPCRAPIGSSQAQSTLVAQRWAFHHRTSHLLYTCGLLTSVCTAPLARLEVAPRRAPRPLHDCWGSVLGIAPVARLWALTAARGARCVAACGSPVQGG